MPVSASSEQQTTSAGVDEYEDVVDPDIDLHDPAQAGEGRTRQWDLIAAIAAGGVVGAEARYLLGLALPHTAAGFPTATFLVNVSGSLVIGALMVVLLELTSPHRLARPFLAVGVLGGYTTFSTFAVEAERLVSAKEPLLAVGYVAATLVCCLVAVWLSTSLTLVLGRRIRARRRRSAAAGRSR